MDDAVIRYRSVRFTNGYLFGDMEIQSSPGQRVHTTVSQRGNSTMKDAELRYRNVQDRYEDGFDLVTAECRDPSNDYTRTLMMGQRGIVCSNFVNTMAVGGYRFTRKNGVFYAVDY